MTIAFRAGTANVVQTNCPCGANIIPVTAPTGLVNGDIILVMLIAEQSGCISVNSITPPSGWQTENVLNNFIGSTAAILFSHKASSEPSSWNFTINVHFAPQTLYFSYCSVAYSGCNQTTWIDATTTAQTNGSGTSLTSPSITTVTPNAMVVNLAAFLNTGTITDAAGTIRRESDQGSTSVYAADQTFTAVGATGTISPTITGSRATRCYTVALRPVTTLFYVAPKRPLQTKPYIGTRLNQGHELSNGLVGAWLMNEGSGTSIYDLSPSNNKGTLVGGIPWAAGKFGAALKPNGTNGYVSVPSLPASLSGSSTGTIAAWVYRTPGTLSGFGYGTITSSYRFNVLWYTDNTIYVENCNGSSSGYSYSAAIANAGWSHIVFTFSSGTGKLYVNRVSTSFVGGAGLANTIASSANMGGFWIGREIVNGYCAGIYDNVLVYNRALSAAEVQQLYISPFCFMQQRNKITGRKPPLVFATVYTIGFCGFSTGGIVNTTGSGTVGLVSAG